MSSSPRGGLAGRSRRLGALSLDDQASGAPAAQRVDKTVPLAVYGGPAGSQERTPLPPGSPPAPTADKVGFTTAPLAAQVQPPIASTPAAPDAVAAAPTPSATGEHAVPPKPLEADASENDLEGPPMTKTPWIGIGIGIGLLLLVGAVVALAVTLGGSTKPDRTPSAPPTTSATATTSAG